jgi:hypothetical protein
LNPWWFTGVRLGVGVTWWSNPDPGQQLPLKTGEWYTLAEITYAIRDRQADSTGVWVRRAFDDINGMQAKLAIRIDPIYWGLEVPDRK